MTNVDKFNEALNYFKSIEAKEDSYNPYSPVVKYSSLKIVHYYNEYADYPALNFDLFQSFRTTGSVYYADIMNSEDIKKLCETKVDEKAKSIYASMKRTGVIYGKSFK